MTGATELADLDVLAFVGPGVGHYHPIAALLAELGDPARIGIHADVASTHPICQKVAEDGFVLVPRVGAAPARWGDRLLREARRRLVRRAAPAAARRRPGPTPLPNLAARSLFAGGSLLTPLSEARGDAGRALAALVREVQPRVVLAERYLGWMGPICERDGIAWYEYTTGPVQSNEAGRPSAPTGLEAPPRGAARAVELAVRTSLDARAALAARRIGRVARRTLGTTSAGGPAARLAFSVAELDAAPLAPPSGHRYLGLSPYRAPAGWRDAPSAARRDTILVTWGSGVVRGERELLDRLLVGLWGLAATGLRIVLVSGDAELRARVAASAPDGTDLVVVGPSDRPPYDEFRRAVLVVGHGGYGTINEAVAFGAPVVVLPEMVADRMETAQRVLRAGVGRVADRYTATADQLAEVLAEALADPTVAERVARVGADLRAADDHDRLVAEIRHLLEVP